MDQVDILFILGQFLDDIKKHVGDLKEATENLKDDKEEKTLPEVVFVLGGPGSGKGTQCAILVEKYGFKHISTGDLLRDEVKNGGPSAKEIEECQKEGKLVTSELLVKLIKRKIEKDKKGKFLLDGFPRSDDNLKAWNKIIGKKHAKADYLIYMQCSLETLEKRLIARGATSGRADDNPETIKKRFVTFQEQTEPIAKKFDKKKIIMIDADQGIEEVTAQVGKALVEKKIVSEAKQGKEKKGKPAAKGEKKKSKK